MNLKKLNSAQKAAIVVSIIFFSFFLMLVAIFGLDFFLQQPNFRGDVRLGGFLIGIVGIVWTAVCASWIPGIENR